MNIAYTLHWLTMALTVPWLNGFGENFDHDVKRLLTTMFRFYISFSNASAILNDGFFIITAILEYIRASIDSA
jgi:hypothetical protein